MQGGAGLIELSHMAEETGGIILCVTHSDKRGTMSLERRDNWRKHPSGSLYQCIIFDCFHIVGRLSYHNIILTAHSPFRP